jgi:oxazoline/thiazoline dehydrogenase
MPSLVRLVLADGAELAQANGSVTFRAEGAEHVAGARSAVARELFKELGERPLAEADAETRLLEEEGVEELTRFCLDTTTMLRLRLLGLAAETRRDAKRLATLEPLSPDFRPRAPQADVDTRLRLSRFVLVRADERGGLVVESPLAHAAVRLHSAPATAALYRLSSGASARELAADEAVGLRKSDAMALLELLARAGIAGVLDADGRSREDEDTALRQWDFHDLYFHSRTRSGRHANPVGGRFRFLGVLPPQPAVKSPDWPVAVVLPRPDLARLAATDPPFSAVLEARRSVRMLGAAPIPLERLGEFLYRVARVRRRFSGGDKGEFTSRPYPSGGASYELELYLTVGEGAAVAAGMYWYDPEMHALRLVRGPNADTHLLMTEAYLGTGGQGAPQILFTIAARFQRVSWKYDSIAYAIVLKNTGVLIQTMYLVATAMGLAPCAVGLGDSDRFARAAGTRYVEETSVGEFMLGGSAPA